jgi:hypothetical protein
MSNHATNVSHLAAKYLYGEVIRLRARLVKDYSIRSYNYSVEVLADSLTYGIF